MSAPTFVSYTATVFNTATSPKTTASISVNSGDILTAFAVVEGTYSGSTTLGCSGGSLTWTLRQEVAVTDYCRVYIWTAPATSTASIAVSFNRTFGSSGDYFGGGVHVFRGSDGVGASSKTNASGGPSLGLTTTQADSAIVVAAGDWNAADGSSRTWRTGAGTLTEGTYFRDAGHYVVYSGYHADADAAAAKTVGLSAPTGMKYGIVAVEIKGAASSGPVQGDASLSGDGTMTVAGRVIARSSSALSGDGTLSAAGRLIARSGASMSGDGTMAVSGTTIRIGSSSLSGSGTMTAGGRVIARSSASLPGDATLAASPMLVARSDVVLSGSGTMTVDGTTIRIGSASLTAEGSMAVSGRVIARSAASLSGDAAMTAGGFLTARSSASLGGEGTMAVDGDIPGGAIGGDASLTGSGTMSVDGRVIARSSSTLSGDGTMAVAGRVIARSSAAFAVSGTLAASGVLTARASALLGGDGSIVVVGRMVVRGSASFVATATMTVDGDIPSDIVPEPVYPVSVVGEPASACRADVQIASAYPAIVAEPRPAHEAVIR